MRAVFNGRLAFGFLIYGDPIVPRARLSLGRGGIAKRRGSLVESGTNIPQVNKRPNHNPKCR